jgi:hypothetical protein
LEFKSVFGAVGGYVDGKIFVSCGKFGVALKNICVGFVAWLRVQRGRTRHYIFSKSDKIALPGSLPGSRPVRARPASGHGCEAVMLDLVQPAGSGRRAIDERKLARADEADWRISSPAGCRGAEGYEPQVSHLTASKAAAVMAMRIMRLPAALAQNTRGLARESRTPLATDVHRRLPVARPHVGG